VENEFCPVLVARADRDPVPDDSEVAQWQWVDWGRYCDAVRAAPWAFSPWTVTQTPLVAAARS
jgi:isopentenyl-diphosphate delta-isomerase